MIKFEVEENNQYQLTRQGQKVYNTKKEQQAIKNQATEREKLIFRVQPDYTYKNGKGETVHTLEEANKRNDKSYLNGVLKEIGHEYLKPKGKPMDILDYVDNVKNNDPKTLEMINNYQPTKIPKIKKKDSYQDEWQVIEQAMSEEEKKAFYTDKKLKGYKMETANEKKYSKTVPVKIDFSLKSKLENVNENFTAHLDNIDRINKITRHDDDRITKEYYRKKSDPDLKYGLESLMGIVDD